MRAHKLTRSTRRRYHSASAALTVFAAALGRAAGADAQPDRPLLITCYHAGPQASWGVYRWDAERKRPELEVAGGRHPVWGRNGEWWVCERNGSLWLRRPNGGDRCFLPGEIPSRRRFAQPLADGRIVHLEALADKTGLRVLDTRRWLAAPPGVLTAFDLQAVPKPWPTLPATQGAPWVVDDLAASESGHSIAVVLVRRVAGVGLASSRIGTLDPQTMTVAEVVPPTDGYVDGRPFWTEAERRLLFERVSLATGRRRIMGVALPAGPVGEWQPQLGPQGGDSDLWLLACRRGVVVVGRAPLHQARPAGVAVCTADGALLVKDRGGLQGRWEAAISPDGKRVAYLTTDCDLEPLTTTVAKTSLLELNLETTKTEYLWQKYQPDDPVHGDPLTPYQLAW